MIIFLIIICSIQVSQNVLLLNINGEVAGEKSLSSLNNDLPSDGMENVLLPCIIGDDQGCEAFAHQAEVLPFSLPIQNCYAKVQIYQTLLNLWRPCVFVCYLNPYGLVFVFTEKISFLGRILRCNYQLIIQVYLILK